MSASPTDMPSGFPPVPACRRVGNRLITPPPYALPDGCLKCGTSASSSTMEYYWQPIFLRWAMAVVFIIPFTDTGASLMRQFTPSFLLWLVLLAVLDRSGRQKVSLQIALCETHRKRQGLMKIAAVAALLFGAFCLMRGFSLNVEFLQWVGAGSLVGAYFLARRGSRPLSIIAISGGGMTLSGFGPGYLDRIAPPDISETASPQHKVERVTAKFRPAPERSPLDVLAEGCRQAQIALGLNVLLLAHFFPVFGFLEILRSLHLLELLIVGVIVLSELALRNMHRARKVSFVLRFFLVPWLALPVLNTPVLLYLLLHAAAVTPGIKRSMAEMPQA